MGQRADAISERDRERLDAADSPEMEMAIIREEIEQTREEMSETIDVLEAKLNPSRLMAQMKDTVREDAQVRADQAKQAIRDTAEARLTQARQAALNLLDDLRADAETVRQEFPRWAHRLRDQSLGETRDQAQVALFRLRRWRTENPKAFQVTAGIAAGSLALLGLVVARSQRRARRMRGTLAAENVRASVYGLRDTTRGALHESRNTGADNARRVRRVARAARMIT